MSDIPPTNESNLDSTLINQNNNGNNDNKETGKDISSTLPIIESHVCGTTTNFHLKQEVFTFKKTFPE